MAADEGTVTLTAEQAQVLLGALADQLKGEPDGGTEEPTGTEEGEQAGPEEEEQAGPEEGGPTDGEKGTPVEGPKPETKPDAKALSATAQAMLKGGSGAEAPQLANLDEMKPHEFLENRTDLYVAAAKAETGKE